jgi:hypothetical protein
MSSLVVTAPPPQQPSAITTTPHRDPVPTQQEPIMPRPLREQTQTAPRPSRPANRPAHTLANELRAIAQSSHTKQEGGEDGKPWWMSWGMAPILLAFLGMVGLKGDNVVEHLTQDDDQPKRHGLFG